LLLSRTREDDNEESLTLVELAAISASVRADKSGDDNEDGSRLTFWWQSLAGSDHESRPRGVSIDAVSSDGGGRLADTMSLALRSSGSGSK